MRGKTTLDRVSKIRLVVLSILFPVVGTWIGLRLHRRRNELYRKGTGTLALALSDLMKLDRQVRRELALEWIARVYDRSQSEPQVSDQQTTVQPEVDLAFNSDVEIRKRAVLKLSQSRKPRRLQVLRYALRDVSNEVRTMAGVVLAKTEQQLSEEVERSSDIYEQTQLRILRLSLNFVSGEKWHQELHHIEQEMHSLIAEGQKKPEIYHYIGRVEYLRKNFKAAIPWFEKAIEANGGVFSRSQGFLSECYFEEGMWEELRSSSQLALIEPERIPPVLARSVRYWGYL